MLIGPTVTVLGAGSLRAGAGVIATLIGLPLDPGTRLILQDRDAEMLDLFDRLARALAAYSDQSISILATVDGREAVEDADALVLCSDLHTRGPDRRYHAEAVADEMLLASRVASERAVLLFNLVPPVELSAKLLDAEAFHVDWPPPLPEGREFSAAHQAHRWVRADEPAFEPLKLYCPSPLTAAILDARPGPENRYSAGALEEWLQFATTL